MGKTFIESNLADFGNKLTGLTSLSLNFEDANLSKESFYEQLKHLPSGIQLEKIEFDCTNDQSDHELSELLSSFTEIGCESTKPSTDNKEGQSDSNSEN